MVMIPSNGGRRRGREKGSMGGKRASAVPERVSQDLKVPEQVRSDPA